MDPKDVLIKNSVKFYNELDAKPLFLQLKYIFPTSVAQEIERVIDREGNIMAIDKILTCLPRRDNWVKTFWTVLRGKEIDKPELASLFDPFINNDPEQHSHSLPIKLRPTTGSSAEEEEEEPRYSLDTLLKDIEYFKVLKDLYPSDPPKWKDFIKKHGFPPDATLSHLLDHLSDVNMEVYEQIKIMTKIRHSIVRQATQVGDSDYQRSLPLSVETSSARYSTSPTIVSDTKKSNIFTGKSDFQLSNTQISSEIMKDQEKAFKAFKEIPDIQAEENMTKTVPSTSVPTISLKTDQDSAMFLPTMPVTEFKKKFQEIDEVKTKVPEVEMKRKIPEIDKIKSEISEISEVKNEDDGMKRKVLKLDENKKALQLAKNKKEVLQVAENKKEVPQVAENKKEDQQVAEGKKEVPQVAEEKKKVPQVAKDKKEVSQVAEDKKEVPEVKREVAEVPEAQEPENGSLGNETSLPVEINEERNNRLIQLGLLVFAVVLSFSLSYFYRRR